MSRESAYRLRGREPAGLFAHLWDLAFAPNPLPLALLKGKGHSRPLGDGRLMRLLGNHFRRKRGDFRAIGDPCAKDGETRRTRPL